MFFLSISDPAGLSCVEMEGGKFYATILSVSEYSRTDTLWVYVSIVGVKDLKSPPCNLKLENIGEA